ncbi:MAG: hypothetical protein ACO266_05020 [Steroidobacteraceae bacterium]|jgi:hypothetical protein
MIFGMVGLLILLLGGVALFGLRMLAKIRKSDPGTSPAHADQVTSVSVTQDTDP